MTESAIAQTATEAAAVASGDPRATPAWIRPTGAVVLYVALFVAHVGLGVAMAGPVVYSDEGAYLGTAQFFAHGTGLLYLGTPYHPGYPALLVLFAWLLRPPLTFYRAALVTNAALMATVGPLTFVLTGWFMDRARLGRRFAVATVVGVYPAFLVFTNLAMTMSLFIPLTLLTCVAVGWGLSRGNPAAWIVGGLASGWLYAVHPQGAIVVVVLLAVLVVIAQPLVQRAIALAATVGGAAIAVAGAKVLIHRVNASQAALAATSRIGLARPPTTVPAQRAVASAHAVAGNLSFTRLGNDAYNLAGQLWYLTVATYGLVVPAVVLAGVGVKRLLIDRDPAPGPTVAAFVGAVLVATVVASVLRIPYHPGRPGGADEFIYGRFNENVLAPVLALGGVFLARVGTRQPRAWWLWCIAVGLVVVATGGALRAGRSATELRSVAVDVNVLAVRPLLDAFGGIDVVKIGLVGVGAAVVVVGLARWRGVAAAAVPVVVLSLASASYSARGLVRESDGRKHERVIVAALALIRQRFGITPRCIAYDIPMEHVWQTINDQFFLPHVTFQRFSSADAQRPCSDLVITGRLDLASQYAGARLMTAENFSPTKLWILMSPLQQRLSAAGLLLPPGFPTALPPTAYRSALRLAAVGPGTRVLAANRQRRLTIAVTHRGTGAPWPSRQGYTTGSGWVRLTLTWLHRDNPVQALSQTRFDLPGTVYPGQTVDVDVRLVPRDEAGAPLAPGDYVVQVGLVQEGFHYFPAVGDGTLNLAVTVGPPV